MVILELRQEFPLAMLLEIARLPGATFYYHAKRMVQAVWTEAVPVPNHGSVQRRYRDLHIV